MEKGFIMLSRKFFSNEMWEAARTFSECEAWLDLIQSVRFEATDKTECIGGREITYKRGQYPASNRFLAKKWMWGEQKVKSFLSKLKRKGMIETDSSQGMNIITLLKYDEYNSNNPSNNPPSNPDNKLNINELKDIVTHLITQQTTQCQPSGNPNSNKENKENNYNNLSLDVSFDSFWDSYDKKVGRPKCEKKWEALSQKEKIEAMRYIPEYVKSQPDKKFRKNPETFLNQKSWNDEIIISDGKTTSTSRPAYQSTAERIREESAWHIQGIAARLSSGAALPDGGEPDVF